MRKHIVALIVGAALSMGSSSAWALAYTISSSVAFNESGVIGTINPVTSITGSTTCLTGTCDSGTQDWLLVSVSVTSGAVDRIGISLPAFPSIPVVGVGHYSDPDETPTGGLISPSTLALFYYGVDTVTDANLNVGETSDRLFATFASDALPGPGLGSSVPAGTVSFMIGIAAGTLLNSVTSTVVVVPEPGTLLLLGVGGLLGLGVAGRRRV